MLSFKILAGSAHISEQHIARETDIRKFGAVYPTSLAAPGNQVIAAMMRNCVNLDFWCCTSGIALQSIIVDIYQVTCAAVAETSRARRKRWTLINRVNFHGKIGWALLVLTSVSYPTIVLQTHLESGLAIGIWRKTKT